VLVTTPESLSLMLTREDAREELHSVEFVVVDEWHELIGSKRGVQAQLAISNTFSMSVNDYGFELVAAVEFDLAPVIDKQVFSTANPLHDVLASLNSTELAQRRFREIARVAGLVFSGYPGQPKSTRQLQASSGLFFEVFRKHDKGNLLLGQAEREILSQELEISRLRATLIRLAGRTLALAQLRHPSPMSPSSRRIP
jgi:ATP-dependent Lhr-like helicase